MGTTDPRKGFEALTYLYIRTNPSDDGTEPLPAGLAGWISPDINIISNNPPDPAPDSGIAVEHQVNTIEVIVTNAGGVAANSAFVECFESDPATGFSPGSTTVVGAGFLTIPGTQTNTIQFNWTPQHSGHRCLLARVSLMFPPDTFRDSTWFDVYGDRHVAQRNLHVNEVLAPSQQFKFRVVNPFPEARVFTLVAQDITAQKDRLRAYPGLQKKGLTPAQKGVNSAGLVMVAGPDQPTPRLDAPQPLQRDAKTAIAQPVEIKAPPLTTGPLSVQPRDPVLVQNQALTLQMKPHEVLSCSLTVVTNPGIVQGGCNILEISLNDARTKKSVGGLTCFFAKTKK